MACELHRIFLQTISNMSKPEKKDSNWDLIIEPTVSWFKLNLADVWRYRDLITMFVKRDLVVVYKQTLLGPIWYFVQPLLSALIFSVVFGKIAGLPTDGAPAILFYLSGLLCWNYFASCVTSTSDTFTANASIFGKVYFPRLILPLSICVSNLSKVIVQLILLVSIYAYFVVKGTNVQPSFWILFFPVMLLQIALLGLGFGILISSFTTKYRDLQMLLGFGVQLWMYASPVAYSANQVPQQYRWLYDLNPMVAPIVSFRAMVLNTTPPLIETSLYSLIFSFVLLFFALIVFSRAERTFIDTV